ncbi:hypothetical protein HAX54_007281 [Datura stramonium]|uniref:Uncharacterized protein n=1 Tax=Datura stramonium TaxID=4076 RepID=A0ABS8TCE2_DATST|nr:hypothetical protein [Datura stramonium]
MSLLFIVLQFLLHSKMDASSNIHSRVDAPMADTTPPSTQWEHPSVPRSSYLTPSISETL